MDASVKQQLTEIYQKLNPAELKRNLKRAQNPLYEAYCKKQKPAATPLKKVGNFKKLTPRSATFLIAEPMAVQR